MTREEKMNGFLKNAGYRPVEGKAIIVKYAPEDLSDQIAKFFSMEFYIMQLCEDSIVLVPFTKLSMSIGKEVALEIPFARIRRVTIIEEYMNYRITFETEEGTVSLSAQQAGLSEFRSSGTLAAGFSSLSGGLAGTKYFRDGNWHRKNLAGTLAALKALTVQPA